MKNALALLAACLLLGNCATAQTERGRFLIGGSADISSARQGKNSNFNLGLSPSFGVFVVKGFAIGGRYSFAVSSNRNFDNKQLKYITTTTFTSGIGPQFKYYPGKKQLKGLISFTPLYTTSTTLREKNVSGTNGFNISGNAGIAYFLNNNISLEAGIYAAVAGAVKQLPVTRIGFQLGFFAFIDKKKKEDTLQGGQP